VFDLTNLKGEKRRNVGKLNNELNIVNQPCRSTLPEIEKTALPRAVYTQNALLI
jgi:hypothetical protein